VKTVL